jgi:hypothetical protein
VAPRPAGGQLTWATAGKAAMAALAPSRMATAEVLNLRMMGKSLVERTRPMERPANE